MEVLKQGRNIFFISFFFSFKILSRGVHVFSFTKGKNSELSQNKSQPMQTSRSVIFQFFFYFITMLNILCFFPAASPHDAVTFVICKCNLLIITFLIYDIQVLPEKNFLKIFISNCFPDRLFWRSDGLLGTASPSSSILVHFFYPTSICFFFIIKKK